MSGEIPTPIGSIAAVVTLLALGAVVGVPTTIAGADDCLAAPNSPAPEGSHWYYKTDRATQRKCWFLRAKDQSTQEPAAQDASEAAQTTPTGAFEESATASVSAPTSISPADSPLSRPPFKPRPAPKSSWTPKEPAEEPAEAPAPPTSTQPPGRAPGVGVPAAIAGADDCLAAPNSPAPEGRHWFYKTDRATQRKCWYLRAKDQSTQQPTAQAASEAVPPARTSAFENATASADVPMSKSAPSLKLQPAPMSGARTEEVGKQSAPKGSTPQSSPAPPQTSAQVVGPAPDATVSPDPPAGASPSAREPNAAPGDARADSVRPKVDARSRDDAESTNRGGASTASAAGMATPLAGTPVKIFLVIAFGLGVASLLYRVVMAVASRRQTTVDHPEPGWIDDQNPHNRRDNQRQYRSVGEEDLYHSHISGEDYQQHRSVDEGDKFTDDLHRSNISGANDHRDDQQQHRSIIEQNQFINDLHRSLISGANDYDARRPHPAEDEGRRNNARGTDGASQITDEVSEREKTLAQLQRDLDWLLQYKST